MVKLLFINELKQDQSCGLNILETFVKFNIKFMDIREQLGFCIIEKHKVFDTRLILYCNQSFASCYSMEKQKLPCFSSFDCYISLQY